MFFPIAYIGKSNILIMYVCFFKKKHSEDVFLMDTQLFSENLKNMGGDMPMVAGK